MRQQQALNNPKILIIGCGGAIAEVMIDIFSALDFTELTGMDQTHLPINKKLKCFIKLNISLDLTLSQREIFSQFDILIFATPFDPFKALFPQIYDHLKPTALLIDLFSIKSNYINLLKEYEARLSDKISIISLHPLFRPDSPLEIRKFLVCMYKASASATKLLNQLKNIISLIELDTIEEHDRLMCFNQVAPHFIILVLATFLYESGISYNLLKSTNTAYMEVVHCIISRILAGKPHVYWEIQSLNKFSKDTHEKLTLIVQEYRKLFEDNNVQAFNQKFVALQDYFEGKEAYNQLFIDTLDIISSK